MTISSSKLVDGVGAKFSTVSGAALDSSSSTPLCPKGRIYWDEHPQFGLRGFMYCRIDQSGGMTAGQVASFRAPIAINNITSGSTTSITTSGLTADTLVDGILYCLDDAGGAGAAPEGQKGIIVSNSATVVTIDANDAFSASPAANDDFVVILPWAVEDSADGDEVGQVAGVIMADQDQYDYGWVQFYGIHPAVDAVAAGTAIPADESVVADAAVVNDGAGDGEDLRIGYSLHALSSDTVRRKIAVDLFCGKALRMGTSTA